MRSRAYPALAIALFLIAAAGPQKLTSNLPEGHFGADLLITGDHVQLANWHKLPAASRHDHGRLRALSRGPVYWFPVIVEDYDRPEGGVVEFSADIRLLGPTSKARTFRRYSSFLLQDTSKSRIAFVHLTPVLWLQFDKTDPPGRYMIQALVTDRVKNEARSLEEWFELQP